MIREYIDHTARLITELQHLYSVLALSPSTFMETYGSSMRSLNAAATLLSAYQGILIYLNEKFPSKWINSRGKLEVSNYAVLMIPYRMTQSSSIILYPSFSPEKRLSLIHIDFTKMFNTKQVLFMLMHEAGHMLGDHNRRERFLPFVRAVLKLYLEQQIFGERFTRPGFAFFKLDGEKNIPHGMPPKKWIGLLKRVNKDLSTYLNQLICEQAALDAIQFQSEYNRQRKRSKHIHNKQMSSYFLDAIIPILYSYVSDIYSQIPNNQNLARMADQLTEAYKKEAQMILELPKESPCNQRFFSKVCAYYHVPYRNSIIYSSMVQNGSDNLENLMRGIEAVFQDIHADVFMCKFLNVSSDDYARMLRTFSGHNASVEFEDPCNLIRFDLIFRVLFGIPLTVEILTDKFRFSRNKAKHIISLLQDRRKSNAYSEFQEYAQICYKTISTSIEKIENEKTFNAIRTMYEGKEETEEFMNAVLSTFTEVFTQNEYT